MNAADTEIAIRGHHGIEIATVAPCDGGAFVQVQDPEGLWSETLFLTSDVIGRVGEALVGLARGMRS